MDTDRPYRHGAAGETPPDVSVRPEMTSSRRGAGPPVPTVWPSPGGPGASSSLPVACTVFGTVP